MKDAESYRDLHLRFYPDLGYVEAATTEHPAEVALDLLKLSRQVAEDPELVRDVVSRPITGRKQAAFRQLVTVLEGAYEVGMGRQPSLEEMFHDLGELMPWMEREEMLDRLRELVEEEMSA